MASISNIALNVDLPRRHQNGFYRAYTYGTPISRGGCGTVYEGYCLSSQTSVAIKYINNAQALIWDVGADGFSAPREVVCLEKVAHLEGVIRLLDWYSVDGGPQFILVLEKPANVEDLTVFTYKQPGNRLAEPTAQGIFRQLAVTVMACRQAGVLHCDIKEENVLINRETLKIKLIDFGLADHFNPDKVYSSFLSTPDLEPPEYAETKQFKGADAEVWALGFFLFRVLSGKTSVMSIAGVCVDFGEVELSPQCQDLVRKCLAVRPEDRISLENILAHPWVANSGSEVATEEEEGKREELKK